ncbi:hypothetical protein AJ85_19515 [Alkalihalobacillus alcalophilus ATCC 27647 = CGMCC 1.3604]|uniref:HTH cro/C1-type domain-containing protein n=1 Tax=Alkalihalobacillus alcalophilus ATCC 27647 = CGMCC 1.3604 TaxID=1218173 RepID=A0A094XCA6_ALKAL|nr:helix-turn-helix domain-containing protein [Alkalihalobacillus alcalophilus]KGA96425.1 hypothetical protein BALCAV_0216145 [Alkalihalobacillus alcalophilus ATCC 27647 = CGMCC 1.3604]MED1564305.1 helix-turn-helix domain-containing protein [Alkalihalobacillus alcalophilus]THG89111.1 hypothetical protein AJ85_19515 [Alkalihalobacillus alcalophilus ATCC 27647 = CGMCC 1.3604]
MISINIDTIGKNIKFYRSLKGLTQCELAEGICTQAQISNIEAGKFIPLSTTLHSISKRLGVDMNHFFQAGDNPQYDYIQDFIQEIRRNTVDRNYEEVYNLILAEEGKPLFDSADMKQFILWHKGVAIAYVFKDYTLALKLLFQALELTYNGKGSYSQEEIQILNSIAAVHELKGEVKLSIDYYERALQQTNHIPDLNPRIKVRLLYNYAIAEAVLKNFKHAIELADKGRKLCIQNGLLYLLGECTYHKGYCLLVEDQTDQGKELIEQAIVLFRLEKKDELVNIAEQKVKEVLTKV